ncbi:hypothetical protein AA101099_0825 [Neoasaia chiangmaiensis NBRC 101099]|nr:hypothetical protein AA101099_0825 [Neoasaia chiangmaiensis NBRC 101099]GEN15063.1 hypothetical protein NCH01_14940 [Neoasaia chiangmaiensis]
MTTPEQPRSFRNDRFQNFASQPPPSSDAGTCSTDILKILTDCPKDDRNAQFNEDPLNRLGRMGNCRRKQNSDKPSLRYP